MRYVDFHLVPVERFFHPVEEAILADPAVRREAIHHFNVLDDGTAVVLLEFTGDTGRAVELSESHDDVLSYDLSSSGDDAFVYSRIAADEHLQRLYRLPARHELVLDTPMYYTESGALQIRAIGEQSSIREAMRAVPDGFELELLRLGEYDPGASGFYDQLTERQREVLRTAVDMGYYRNPREATYEDLATELGVSTGTVGEHLRRIEATVLGAVVP